MMSVAPRSRTSVRRSTCCKSAYGCRLIQLGVFGDGGEGSHHFHASKQRDHFFAGRRGSMQCFYIKRGSVRVCVVSSKTTG